MYSYHDPTWKTLENADPEDIFDIIQPLGKGTNETIYKALNKRDGNIVALKIKPIGELLDTMEEELELFKSCQSSYIVKCHGSYIKANNIWLAMEYCEAESTMDVMRVTKRNLTEQEIQIIMRESLKGLQYLHSNKISHKNIRASNILLNHRGTCKLADFGFSHNATSFAYWIAPEQISNGRRSTSGYDVKADIWSLGITAIEMATGKPPHADQLPFKAIFIIAASKPPNLPANKQLYWSPEFRDFIACCTVKDPILRQSARQLLNHKWIKQAKSVCSLRSLVRMAIQEKKEAAKDNVDMNEEEKGYEYDYDNNNINGDMDGQSDTANDETDNSAQGILYVDIQNDNDSVKHDINITEEFNNLYNVLPEQDINNQTAEPVEQQQYDNGTDDDDDVWWIDDDNEPINNNNTSTESIASFDSLLQHEHTKLLSQNSAVIADAFSSHDSEQGSANDSLEHSQTSQQSIVDVHNGHHPNTSYVVHMDKLKADIKRGRGVTMLVQTSVDNDNEVKYEEMKYEYDNVCTVVESLQVEVNKLNQELNSMKSVLKCKDESIQTLRQTLISKEEMSEFEAEDKIYALKTKIEEWQNRYNLFRSTYDALKKDYEKKVHMIAILKQDKNELLHKNNSLMDELLQLKKQMENIDDDEKKEDAIFKHGIYKLKFKNWLSDTVKLEQYVTHFATNECDDIRMIEFLDEDTIKTDIGINNKLHCKLIFKKAKQFKQSQMEFYSMLQNNKELNKYKQKFECNGILTLEDLYNDIQTKKQLSKMLQIRDGKTLNTLWNIIFPTNEGQSSAYFEM